MIEIRLRKKVGATLKKVNQWLKSLSSGWHNHKIRRGVDSEVFARNKSLLETDIFKDANIAFIGLGSLGAPVALDLARCGVGKFVLVDPKRFDVANISRHPCGYLRNVGKFKTDIIGDDVLDINPAAVLSRHRLKVEWNTAEQVRKIVCDSDIVVLTADSSSVKTIINKLCIEENIPLLWSGCYRRAYGGQILKVIPHQTACYECFQVSLPDDGDREISGERSANAPAYSDVEVEAEPGLGIDISPFATMTSKLAVQLLLKGKESTLHSLDEDLDCNFYMYFNRREGKAQDFIPMSDYVDGLRILSWYGVKMPRYDDCICCGNPTVETVLDTHSKELQLLQKQLDFIKRSEKNE